MPKITRELSKELKLTRKTISFHVDNMEIYDIVESWYDINEETSKVCRFVRIKEYPRRLLLKLLEAFKDEG